MIHADPSSLAFLESPRGEEPTWWERSSSHLPELTFRLRSALGSDGTLAEAASYHLASGGKKLRGRVAAGVGLALGLEARHFLPGAVAVELLHEASLVHDDLQDGDRQRRGCDAVWARYGKDTALLLGDAWIAASFAEAARGPSASLVSVVQVIASCVRGLAEGQVRGMAPPRPGTWTPAAYEWVARRKTGRLFALAAELPLAAAGRPASERDSVREALELIGCGFQIYDDIADIVGTKGRDQASDLRSWRLSSVLVHYAEQHPHASFASTCFRPGAERALEDTATRARIDAILRSGSLDACIRQQDAAFQRAGEAASALPSGIQALLDDLTADVRRASLRLLASTEAEATSMIAARDAEHQHSA